MREAVATNPMVPQKERTMIMDVMPVAPPVEFVTCRKISMKGNPIVLAALNVFSGLPIQKIVAMSMPKPRVPLITTLATIERGTLIDGFSISSDIWYC
jgi:hypothetical protein